MDSSNLIANYLNKMTKIQNTLLGIINKEKNIEMDFYELIIFLNGLKICKNRNEFKSLLHLLSILYENNHQKPENMVFIEKIIIHYKDYIIENFQNCDIYSIFKNDNKLLLYLIQSQILKIDENIKLLLGKKDQYFFYHEIKDILKSNIKEEISKEIPDDFILKREKGENDSYLCEIIRKDSIVEFISYVEKNNISFNHEIEESIFETNTLLIGNSVTLIKYAAFFGSIQIFKYLQLNKAELDDSLWIYAIHSQNTEIISILEEQKIKPNNFKKCYNEAIKCHFNDMANYIQENYLQENSDSLSPINYFKYYNFEFIKPEYIDKSIFINLCKYDYLLFVDTLMKTEDIDINASTLIEKPGYYEEDIYRRDSSALFKAIEYNNTEIANLLLENDNIDVNYKYCKSLVIHGLKSIKAKFLFSLALSIVPLFLFIFFQYFSQKNIPDILKISNNWLISVWIAGIFYLINLLANIISDSLQVPFSIQLLLYIKSISLNSLEIQIETITALHLACINNNAEIVKALLKKENIDVNAIYCLVQNEVEESTALNFAINNEEIVKSLLLNPNIDINIKYKLSITNSFDIEFIQNIETCILFIMAECIYFWILIAVFLVFCLVTWFRFLPRARKKYLLLILVCAVIVYYILHKDAIIKINSLINLINSVINWNKYEKRARYLFYLLIFLSKQMIHFVLLPQCFLSLFYCDYIEKTPLLSAIENGHTEIAKLLLSCKNIDVSSTYKNRYYEKDEIYYKDIYITKTALNIAAEKNDTEIVKLLLLNPNTNIEDTYKYFSSSRSEISFELWLFYALDSLFDFICPISKKTSLNIAVENTNIDVVKQLLEKSNIKSVKNDFRKIQQENEKEVSLLKENENDSKESSEKKDEILKLIQNFIDENHTN